MKRFLLPLFAMLMAFAMNAEAMQPQVRTIDTYSQMSEFQQKQMEAKIAAAMRESSEQVHIILDLPEDAFLPQMAVKFFNEEFWGMVTMFDFETGVPLNERIVDLPSGTYDFCCEYMNEGLRYFIILEEVNLMQQEEIIFDSSTVTNCIIFRYSAPDGKDFSYPSDDENSNTIMNTQLNSLNCQPYKFMAAGIEGIGFTNRQPISESTALRVNPLSSRYIISSSMLNVTSDGDRYFTQHLYPDVKDGVVHVDCSPSLYTEIDIPYSPTPINLETSEVANPPVPTLWCGYNRSGALYGYLYDGPIGKTYMNNTIPLSLDVVGEYWMPSGDECLISVAEDRSSELFIWGAPIAMKEGELFSCPMTYLFAGFQNDENGNFTNLINPDSPFAYFEKDVRILRGNTAPVLSLETSVIDLGGGLGNFYYPYYFGRLNEWRDIDAGLIKYEVKWKGDVVCETGTDLQSWAYQFASQAHNKNKYEFTVTDNNVLVDGMPGFNKTYAFANWNRGDYTAPTVTRLQFRDGENFVTDRFVNPEDGKLMMAAADFNGKTHPEKGFFYYELGEIEVKVEYAPMGTEDWKELYVDRKEAATDRTEGFYYEGSLDCVDSMSANGWFDLRITTTDVSGNYQVQTISPAFSVESLTGVDAPRFDADAEVVYYNLQGLRLARPAKGVNIVRNADGSVGKKIFD